MLLQLMCVFKANVSSIIKLGALKHNLNQGIDCKILIDLIDYRLASKANLGFDSEPLWTTALNPN